MWLLDSNIPKKLTLVLSGLGVESATAQSRGWGNLSNGSLVKAAATAGFSCLLTRDRLFAESASGALRSFPTFSVVVVTLPQLREPLFLEAFRAAWQRAPIRPVGGEISSWPALSL